MVWKWSLWDCEHQKIYIIWETLSSGMVWVTLDKMQFQLKVNWFLHRNSLLKLPLMKVSAETFAVVTVSHYKRLKKSKALGRFADWESTIHTAHMHTVLYSTCFPTSTPFLMNKLLLHSSMSTANPFGNLLPLCSHVQITCRLIFGTFYLFHSYLDLPLLLQQAQFPHGDH